MSESQSVRQTDRRAGRQTGMFYLGGMTMILVSMMTQINIIWVENISTMDVVLISHQSHYIREQY